jgi:hypothetical protein
MFTFTAYLTRLLQLILSTPKRALVERAEELQPDVGDIPLTQVSSRNTGVSVTSTVVMDSSSPSEHDQPISPIEGVNERRATPPGGTMHGPASPASSQPSIDMQRSDERRATPPGNTLHGPASSASSQLSIDMQRSEDPRSIDISQDNNPQTSPTKIQQLLSFLYYYGTITIYSALLFFVGLPVYFTTGYSMPAHLTLSVLAFHTALAIPSRWRQFLHPSMVGAVIIIVGIWVLSRCRGVSFVKEIAGYQTKIRYLQVFRGEATRGGVLPGAGDVLSSVLDVSIVAFALPMFKYRGELKRSVGLSYKLPHDDRRSFVRSIINSSSRSSFQMSSFLLLLYLATHRFAML